MIFAVGMPGQVVRIFVRAPGKPIAEEQCRFGEVCIEAPSDEPATISVDGQSVVRLVELETLPAAKARLRADIDARAGEARRKWLTMAPGQADTYRAKLEDVASLNTLGATRAVIREALETIPAGEQLFRWPYLCAEMQARGLADLVEARDTIQLAADASREACAEIEQVRVAAKLALQNAATLPAAELVAANAIFPA